VRTPILVVYRVGVLAFAREPEVCNWRCLSLCIAVVSIFHCVLNSFVCILVYRSSME